MCKGFMRFSRERITEFEWLSNPTVCYFFFRLLFKAKYKDSKWQGITIKRGQLVAGRKSLSTDFNLSERQVRTCLEKLKETGYIDQQTTNKYTIITICDYEGWQYSSETNDQQNVTQPTNDRPTTDQRPTTLELNKEIKQLNNKKEELTNVSEKKTEDCSELENMFDTFRRKYKKYGGTARGLNIEFENLKKKHKDWKEIIPLLMPALEKENDARQRAIIKREFFPQMKNLQTYINNRSWECYSDDTSTQTENEYAPLTDGIMQRWNSNRKCLEFNGYIDMLNDGYNKDNRPDGATIAWSMYTWIWSAEKKEWVQQ